MLQGKLKTVVFTVSSSDVHVQQKKKQAVSSSQAPSLHQSTYTMPTSSSDAGGTRSATSGPRQLRRRKLYPTSTASRLSTDDPGLHWTCECPRMNAVPHSRAAASASSSSATCLFSANSGLATWLSMKNRTCFAPAAAELISARPGLRLSSSSSAEAAVAVARISTVDAAECCMLSWRS